MKSAPLVTGVSFTFFGMNFWTTECSNPPPGAIDTVCLTYAPYYWLAVLGLEIVVAWGFGILMLETKPVGRLRSFWQRVSSTRRAALLVTTVAFGLIGIVFRWIMGHPPFYPENFLQDYAPWLLGGAVAGFVFAALLNWDSLREAGRRNLNSEL